MSLALDIQIATDIEPLPDEQAFLQWASETLRGRRERAELTIRLVGEVEGRMLNREYRGKDYATNVLSFPSQLPDIVDTDLLGDLVICAPVVASEADEQSKELMAHWAHMVVHGALHLLGYDHQSELEAEEMEAIESSILLQLGFCNPYREQA